MRGVALVVVLVGCDVPSADLDGDGIADADDLCQTSPQDERVDIDGDGKDATQDLCPHDRNAVAGDRDHDGIPDACDPFFDEVRLDTRRCVTSFGVRWMNAAYLTTRAGELPFDLTPPLRARPAETVSTVSTFAFAHPTVSFDVAGEVTLEGSGSVVLWLRATTLPSIADVGCGFDLASGVFVHAAGAPQAPRPHAGLVAGTALPFRLRASVGGAGANVLCRLTIGADTVTTFFASALPEGTWGFASRGAALRIDSVVVDTNDAAVPYRYRLD